MLQRSLHEMAVGAILGGPEVATLLARQLQPTDHPSNSLLQGKNFVEACRTAVGADLDSRWPRQFRLNELESIAAQVCLDSFLVGPELPVLDALFNELMEVDGELICFRMPHVQAFMRVSAEIEPAAIVGWYLAGIAHGTGCSELRRFERLVTLQSSFFSPRSFEHRPVAENHAHIGGTFGDGAVLSKLVLAVVDSDLSQGLTHEHFPEDRSTLERARRARRLVSTFLQIWRRGRLDKQSKNNEQDLERASRLDESILSPATEIHWTTFVASIDVGTSIDSRWLAMSLSQSLLAGDLETAWLWLYVALWYSYRDPMASMTCTL